MINNIIFSIFFSLFFLTLFNTQSYLIPSTTFPSDHYYIVLRGVRWYASVMCISQERASLSTHVKAGAWPKYYTMMKDYLWPVTDLVQTVIRKWVKNLSLHTTTIIMSYWRGYVSIFQYFIQNNLVFCSYDHNIITVFRFEN